MDNKTSKSMTLYPFTVTGVQLFCRVKWHSLVKYVETLTDLINVFLISSNLNFTKLYKFFLQKSSAAVTAKGLVLQFNHLSNDA